MYHISKDKRCLASANQMYEGLQQAMKEKPSMILLFPIFRNTPMLLELLSIETLILLLISSTGNAITVLKKY